MSKSKSPIARAKSSVDDPELEALTEHYQQGTMFVYGKYSVALSSHCIRLLKLAVDHIYLRYLLLRN